MKEELTAPTRASHSFQPVKPEYADASIRRASTEKQLPEDDTAVIREYIAKMRASNGIGTARANKLTSAPVNRRRFIGPSAAIPLRTSTRRSTSSSPRPAGGGR